MGQAFIIGAGLSGLSAAVALAKTGVKVTVFESAGQAGGRCRTFFDRTLDREIDNGNHLIMSGNKAALTFLATIGAADAMTGPAEAAYPFVDVKSGARWRVRLNAGPVPLWIFDSARRVPGTGLFDYVRAARIAAAPKDATVADVVDRSGPLYKTFWEPLTLAVLNTTPEIGSAARRSCWAPTPRGRSPRRPGSATPSSIRRCVTLKRTAAPCALMRACAPSGLRTIKWRNSILQKGRSRSGRMISSSSPCRPRASSS